MARTRKPAPSPAAAPPMVAGDPPGMARRPQVEIPAATYGDRQAIAGIQQHGGGIGAPAGHNPRHVAAVNAPVGAESAGAFGPTMRPNEPITAGAPFGPGMGKPRIDPTDADLLLQAMMSVLPHPSIIRLLHSENQQ